MITVCHFWPRTFFRSLLLFGLPRLLIFRLSVAHPLPPTPRPHPLAPFIKIPPIIWNLRVHYENVFHSFINLAIYFCLTKNMWLHYAIPALQQKQKPINLKLCTRFRASYTMAMSLHENQFTIAIVKVMIGL